MSYQFYDNGASIRILHGSGEEQVAKNAIREMCTLNGDTLVIKMVDGRILSVNYHDVAVPSGQYPFSLGVIISGWVGSCICSDYIPDSGPSE